MWGLLTLGSSGTGAFVGIDQVNAGAPVLARLGETLIDLLRTVGPQVSWHALGDRERKKREASLINVLHETKMGFVYFAVFCFHSFLPRPAESPLQGRITQLSCLLAIIKLDSLLTKISSNIKTIHS